MGGKPFSLEDFIGKKYGMLTVIGESSKRANDAHMRVVCECDCGEIIHVSTNSLLRGDTKSCGNHHAEFMRLKSIEKTTKYIGKKYGFLTIIGVSEKWLNQGGHIVVDCVCDCGRQTSVILKNLKNGMTSSCGCYKRNAASEKFCIDETGNRYGYVTVLSRAGVDKEEKATWNCRCELCGTEFVVQGKSLRADGRIACITCAHKLAGVKARKIAIGDKFGSLTVLGVNENRVLKYGTKLIYDCQCECGTIKPIWGSALLSGLTTSCGCVKESKGEALIRETLDNLKIDYIPQHTFDDCKFKSHLFFDFFIPFKNTVIEYQGLQHYEPVKFFGGEKDFEARQLRDQIKRDYCRSNGVNLIEIRYDQKHMIPLIIEEIFKTA